MTGRTEVLATIAVALFSLAGCSAVRNTLVHETLEKVTDGQIESGGRCQTLKLQCENGHYREWEKPNGVLACSCDNSGFY